MDDKAKKTLTTVGILILVVLFITLCGRYTFLKYQGDLTDSVLVEAPEETVRFAHEMIDYELPSGYYEFIGQEQGATNILLIKQKDSTLSEIILTEYTQEEIVDRFNSGELTVEDLAEGIQDESRYSMKLAQRYELKINGNLVPIWLYTGVNEEGVEINQLYTGLVNGKRFPMIIIITEPLEEWDVGEIDDFLLSIH